ncbi:methyltransferase domain-containing protein [Jatrophihabitans fulvus]
MSELHEQQDRARSFGSVAAIYDRIRPTYPDALVVELLSGVTAGGDGAVDVLDVGCGTGRAGQLLAARGCRVLGVEPDAGMAEVAREHGLEVEVTTFEQWDAAGRDFDLLVSGQAWHWVDPVPGARKAAAVLRPGGRVGLFWNMDTMAGDDRAALDAAYESVAPQLVHRNRTYGGKNAPREPVLEALTGAGFVEVGERDFPWERRYTPEEYVLLVQTFSDHNLLPDGQRARLLDAVGDAVAELGGIAVSYDCHLISGVRP